MYSGEPSTIRTAVTRTLSTIRTGIPNVSPNSLKRTRTPAGPANGFTIVEI